MTPTVINASMSDLVAVAFYHVGYRPRESIVLVGLRGPRSRVGTVLRGDLPPASCQRRVLASQLAVLRRGGDDGVIGLVVSDAAVPVAAEGGGLRMPRRTLARELQRQAGRLRIQVLDVLAVGPSHWRSYRCSDPGCCPPQGHLLDDALTGPAAAQLVALGHVLAPDEAGLVADVEPSVAAPRCPAPRAEPDGRPGGEHLGGECPGGECPGGECPGGECPGGECPGGECPGGECPGDECPGGECPGGECPGSERPGSERPGDESSGGGRPGREHAAGERAGVDGTSGPADPGDAERALQRWRELLAAPARATGDDLAWLAGALEDPWLRDSALLTLVPGAGTVPEEMLAGADSGALDAVLTHGPDPELLERGRLLLAAVARSAPPGQRADALALLAWAAWWSGHGTRGRLLAERALADVPGHRLADLVHRLIVLAVPPEWARGGGPGPCGAPGTD